MACHVAAWRARSAAIGSDLGDETRAHAKHRSTPATAVTSAGGPTAPPAQVDDQDRQVDDGGGASPAGTVAA